jgi:hypothetical protein
VEVAVATGTHPDQWLTTDDAVLATVLDVLISRQEGADGGDT